MKFHEHPNSWALFKKSGLAEKVGIDTPEAMYDWLCGISDPNEPTNILGLRHAAFDREWHKLGCPYYDVYPSVIPMLTTLNLNIPGDQIRPPHSLRHLVLRLPEAGYHIEYNGLIVRTVFLSFQTCARHQGSREIAPAVCVGIDIGERDITGFIPMFTMRTFPIDERPIEETMTSLRDYSSMTDGIKIPPELIDDCVRLALTTCLIGDNPELITPQVLRKDERKLDDADEERRKQLQDKAKRRGKFGFSLGAQIEKAPHFRRPHLATVWTGQGRKVPKVVMRKGSVVHREKIETVPTGYLGEDHADRKDN